MTLADDQIASSKVGCSPPALGVISLVTDVVCIVGSHTAL